MARRRFSPELRRVAADVYRNMMLQVPITKFEALAEADDDSENDYYGLLARASWRAAVAFVAAGQDARDAFNASLDQEPTDTSAMSIDDAVDAVARKPGAETAQEFTQEVAPGVTVKVTGVDAERVKVRAMVVEPTKATGEKPPCQCPTCQLRRQLSERLYGPRPGGEPS